MPEKTSITIKETARLLGVSRPTVYRLLERGRLSAAVHPVTGRRTLNRGEVLALLKRGVEVEASFEYVRGTSPADRMADGIAAALHYGEEAWEELASHPAVGRHAPRLSLHGTPPEPPRKPGGPPLYVDSIFRAPELRLDLGVPDLSERIEHYRFHGLPPDETHLPGHLGSGSDDDGDR